MEAKDIKKTYFKGKNISDEIVVSFVNDIWRRFLSEDNYLVIPISQLSNIDSLEEFLKNSVYGFRILNKDTVKIIPAGEIGLIVNVDWMESDKIYMPDELFNTKYFRAYPNIVGVYSVNNGEGILSSSYENALHIAQTLDIPFTSFDKHDYDATYEMDYDSLVSDVICTYLIKSVGKLEMDLRDKLIRKYGNAIITAYRMLKIEKAFTDVGFMKKIISFIDEFENIKGPKL